MLKKSKVLRPTLFLMVLSAVLGLLLGFVQDISKEQIEINYYFEVQKALLYTVNIDTETMLKEDINALFKTKMTEQRLRGIRYYVYKEDGDIQGYCFPFIGKGLWGTISGYIAIDPDANTLLGIVFTSHSETPGLGARIDELWFKEQFRGLDISSDGEYVKYGIGKEKVVDAITGATMTSDSVKTILESSIPELKKIVEEDLDE